MSDTIFALSSGTPPAAIAIIRLSGPHACAALEGLSGRSAPPPRRVALRALRDDSGALLDHALVHWAPAPDTATGEEIAELHLHGGRAVIAAVLDVLATVPELRPALAGEFTRRAFTAGRIALGEAEALADLIAAETEQQRRLAAGRLDGRFGRRMEAWRTRLLELAATVEALIEFGDDDPLAVMPQPLPRAEIIALGEEIGAALSHPPAERLRDGVRVAIAGPPNAGKSTLLNALAGRPAAIVSDIAGTTRDLIEVPVAIDGIPFLLIDTAGLRGTQDPLEAEGIARAEAALTEADIILWLGAPAAAPGGRFVRRLAAKADLGPVSPDADLAISAHSGEGMIALRHGLIEGARNLLPGESEITLNQRQHRALADARKALAIAAMTDDELIVADGLQAALAAFDAAIGRTTTEDMLDALFGSLCIGK